jgi:hypothetical protein
VTWLNPVVRKLVDKLAAPLAIASPEAATPTRETAPSFVGPLLKVTVPVGAAPAPTIARLVSVLALGLELASAGKTAVSL